MKNKLSSFKFSLIYIIILFFASWSLYELVIDTYIKINYSINIYAMLRLLFKLLIWVFPVYIYLKFYKKTNVISYLRLNENINVGLLWSIILSLIFTAFLFIRELLIGSLRINLNIEINTWINTILFVGITEEIMFRGFLLKILWEKSSFKKAVIISSILFVIIHYPFWIVKGTNLVFNSIYVLVFSIIQSYVFKKTNSLWACIISHSFHNFIVSIL